MDSVKSLHNKAMELKELAMQALKAGDKKSSKKYYAEASETELKAFVSLNQEPGEDPSRFDYMNNAIHLAIEAGMYEEAEKLIAMGLTLTDLPDTRTALRQMLQDLSFRIYLEERNFRLAPNELQISLSGPGVGNGLIDHKEVFDRIEKIQRLIYRTAHRIMNLPFKDRLRKPTARKDYSCSIIAQPVPVGFGITLRFGTDLSKINPLFPEIESPSLVIDDIFLNIERINQGRFDELKTSIPDETYRMNFIALTGKIAPDGKVVDTINLVSTREGTDRHIVFNKTRSAFSSFPSTAKSSTRKQDGPEERITLTGTLSFADADKNRIKLTDEHGKKHLIAVPKGLLTDIVKPHFKEDVEIHAIQKGGTITLQDINPM